MIRVILAAALCAVCCTPVFAEGGGDAPGPGNPERFEDLESVVTFDRFLETLGEMRDMILEDAADEREASEGMRFLLRIVAMAQEVSVGRLVMTTELDNSDHFKPVATSLPWSTMRALYCSCSA